MHNRHGVIFHVCILHSQNEPTGVYANFETVFDTGSVLRGGSRLEPNRGRWSARAALGAKEQWAPVASKAEFEKVKLYSCTALHAAPSTNGNAP